MGSQLCHERLVLQPFVVKVSSFIIGDILGCQQLVIDPESELWAERVGSMVPECPSLARGPGEDCRLALAVEEEDQGEEVCAQQSTPLQLWIPNSQHRKLNPRCLSVKIQALLCLPL